jgi:hypothetical protein
VATWRDLATALNLIRASFPNDERFWKPVWSETAVFVAQELARMAKTENDDNQEDNHIGRANADRK